MDTGRKRRGRPARTPGPQERVKLGLRVTPRVKKELDMAAFLNGRSQSQEAEFRLERSYDRIGLVPEVLELAYGSEIAGLLLSLGHVIKSARIVSGISAVGDYSTWLDDPYVFDAVANAVRSLMEVFRPPGEIDKRIGLKPHENIELGEAAACGIVRSLQGKNDPTELPAEEILRLIGPTVAKRLKEMKL